MLEGLFDRNHDHRRGLLAIDSKTPLQDLIDADLGPTLTRYVSLAPGTKKISATRGSPTPARGGR
jgi:hypothetical protein